MTTAKILALLRKDWQEALSYRMAFLFQSVGPFAPLVGLYFATRVFDGVHVIALNRYGGDYVTFVLMGFVVVAFSSTALRAFSSSLRRAQLSGNLEVLLLTRASLPTILFGWSLYPFLRATVIALIYLASGFLVLGVRLGNANLLGALLAVALTVISLAGMGIIAASFTLVFKRGEPFNAALILASSAFSGAFYPVDILPKWLQGLAHALPHTYTIEALRLTVLQGYPLEEVLPQLVALSAYAALILPLGLYIFSYSMQRARMDGSLTHY